MSQHSNFNDAMSQQSGRSGAIQGGVSVINLEESIDDSPSKHSRNMQYMKEESSFLPDQIVPPSKVEKKKIIKRVRFHDDETEVLPQNNLENGMNQYETQKQMNGSTKRMKLMHMSQ